MPLFSRLSPIQPSNILPPESTDPQILAYEAWQRENDRLHAQVADVIACLPVHLRQDVVDETLRCVDSHFDKVGRELDILYVRSLIGMVHEGEEEEETHQAAKRRRGNPKASSFFFAIHSLLDIAPKCAVNKLHFSNKYVIMSLSP